MAEPEYDPDMWSLRPMLVTTKPLSEGGHHGITVFFTAYWWDQ